MDASRLPTPERFWRWVDKGGECWEWQGSTAPSGYGQISSKGPRGTAPLRAHRVAWELTVGPIPEGMSVLHRCDNRSCVNPAPLRIGTVADNAADLRAKRRGPGAPKLTTAQMIEIRRRRSEGETARDLATAFGVSHWTIYEVVRGRRNAFR